MKTNKEIEASLLAAIDGGGTIEELKPSSIFICGPNSHNHIPGHYRASRSGKGHSYHECAVRDNRRGWIPRLRDQIAQIPKLVDAKIEVSYDPMSCWVSGVGPTGCVRIEKKDFSFLCLNVPVAGIRAETIQGTLPKGWVAKTTWWEKQKVA